MIKKAFFIVVPVIAIIVLIYMFGINTYNSKYSTFQADGHIIAKNSKSATEKYFFDTESKYKVVDNYVYIETKDDEKVVVPTESFIHYADGSISTFSKAVVLDLDDLDKETYQYYNIFSETIFVKNSGTYSVNYLDKKLNFTNFLLKINNDKYMIIGQKLKLTIGNTVKEFDNNYLEISYLDGNVIKIENQGVSFQSVDDEVLIEIGDVAIDLSLRNIYKNKERKISMGEITVDSDDNIDISAEDNKSITGEKESEDEDADGNSGSKGGSKGGSGGGGEPSKPQLPDVNSGIVDTTTDNLEQIIDENARIKDAEFKVIDMEVTANRLRATVQITDEAAVLTGDISIKIIEYSTSRVVYETTDDSGSNIIDIENEALIPETNYVLVLNSDYEKNSVTYNKDFVQKTFITDAIGVSLEKYYASENALQLNIKKSNYSDVVSVDVDLMDSNDKTIKTITVPLDGVDNIVEFVELINNTSYKVKVYNFIYKDSVVTDGFTIVKSYETLKKKPGIGATSFSIDKKESKFNMMITNVSDPDAGIISYKYEVYDARTVNDGNSSPITVVEKSTNASAAIMVDGINIERGVPYVFRVVMTFNDNEKEYEYVSEFSEVMKIDGVEFPTVRFTKSNVTFERIVGEIEIIDEGNTIDINSGTVITITYTDSVGNSKSFTSSGSLRIPVDVNNLRSNETYSFAVSTKVDLQDGNPPIDSCYVGSVIVKTEDPNPFSVQFNKIESSATAFSVDARLVKGNRGDTNLEANTLTGISFNLYSGTGVSGALVKSVKSVDRDLEAYSSELRAAYYDKTFRIDPAFFGVRNNDLTSEYYTIEITSAYDYTTYQNNLPIENNTFTVKTEALIPDGPQDPNNSVDYYAIRNRDLPVNERRNDLDDSTIVGYYFRASYDNSKRYALRINYQIHNLDGDVIDTIVYTIPQNGDIEYIPIYLKDGLEEGVTDDDLHRGQQFYITFTVELDTDYDGNTNIIYPIDGILKSTTIAPSRQEPYFYLYPSKADSSQYTWRYTYSDIDHALINKTIYAYIDGVEVDSKVLTHTTKYEDVSFGVSKPGVFSIYAKYRYVDGGSEKQSMLTTHYYEGISTSSFGKIALYPEKNRVIFSFLDFNNNMSKFEKVSAVKIDFESGGKTITLDGLSLKTGNITINYSSLEEFQGNEITPKVTIYYDSGIYGFHNEGDAFAIQQLRRSLQDNLYYYTFANNKFNTSDSADGSYVGFDLKLDNEVLTINDKISGQGHDYPIFVSSYGIAYNSSYISPKKLNESSGVFEGTSTFSFDTIIPGVSVLNEAGQSTISPLINTATVKLTTYGVDNKLNDNKIYLELFKSLDDTASNVEYINTFSYAVSELSKPIQITDLLPETNYYFKVFGYMDGNNNEKVYLYDVDQQRDAVNYYFKTIGNVGISNINVRYTANSYKSRQLYISYNLAQTIGFSYIKYNIYKQVTDENGNVDYVLMENVKSENDEFFKSYMTKYIDIPNTLGFVTGETYKIEIQPVLIAKINGVDEAVYLETESTLFNFKDLYKPYFSISQTPTATSISYRVNIRDNNKTIVDGKYRIRILNEDGDDVTPDEYVDKEYNISNTNAVFEIKDAATGSKYTFNILYKADFYNDVEKIEDFVYSLNSKTSTSSEISLGSVYANTDKDEPSKVNITFFDSYKLTNAKMIRYSIFDENSFSADNECSFTPSLLTSGSTQYYSFKLPETITVNGIYYISMQFLDANGKILAEETVEYRYL